MGINKLKFLYIYIDCPILKTQTATILVAVLGIDKISTTQQNQLTFCLTAGFTNEYRHNKS